MNSQAWAGGSVTTWGGETIASTNSWSDAHANFVIADPSYTLSDFSSVSPKKVWKAQPSLRKVVEFAARNVASVPLHVFVRESDTDRKRDTESEAHKLLKNPAPFVSGPRLLHDIVVDFMLYDKYLVVLLDGQLRRIPAKLIKVKSDFLGGVTKLCVKSPKGEIDVTDAVLAYDAGWGDDEEGGVSPLRTLSMLLEEQSRAVRWRGERWENAPRMSGLLLAPETLPNQVKDRLKNSMAEFRNSKAGGFPLLEKGVKFEQLEQQKPVETSDLEGRQLTDAEVASAYHIPPELVGARKGTFSNIKAFREMLFGPVLGPTLDRIEASLNDRIIPWLAPEGAYCEFNREGAMAGSFAEQASYLQKTVGGPYMTRAEARSLQNLPYIEGTDDLITPMNVTTGGLASPADTDPTQAPPEWGDGT